LKRIFDVISSCFGLSILAPFLLIIMGLIKLESPGPVFYRGVRTGKNGVPFQIYKFRTMVDKAEKLGGGTTALEDPRVTRVGKFLRKFKFDELPQAINIIKGEMSVVGPRPELTRYTDIYDEEEKKILSVLPGITDYSSIELFSLDEIVGKDNADKVFEEKVLKKKNGLRLKYVYENNFIFDMKIIYKTFALLFKKIFNFCSGFLKQ
jgi:lipopolysaccharide/colanic/teichoic acid biosynthesis glycosyltransferase